MGTCNIPPKGWYCTRNSGHTGPCAAYPVHEKVTFKRVAFIWLMFILVVLGLYWLGGAFSTW